MSTPRFHYVSVTHNQLIRYSNVIVNNATCFRYKNGPLVIEFVLLYRD